MKKTVEFLGVMAAAILIVVAANAAQQHSIVFEVPKVHYSYYSTETGDISHLEKEGYKVIRANTPEELQKKVKLIHPTLAIVGKNGGWVFFIDEKNKVAVYYLGPVMLRDNKIFVVKI